MPTPLLLSLLDEAPTPNPAALAARSGTVPADRLMRIPAALVASGHTPSKGAR